MKHSLKNESGFSAIITVTVLSSLLAMGHFGAQLYVNNAQNKLLQFAKAKGAKNEARAALEIGSVLLQQGAGALMQQVNGKWTPSVIVPSGSFSWSLAGTTGISPSTSGTASSAPASLAGAGFINSLLPLSPSDLTSAPSATPESPAAREKINMASCSPSKMSAADLASMFGNQSYPSSCTMTEPLVEVGNLVNEKIDVTARFETASINARIHTTETPSPAGPCTEYKNTDLVNSLFLAYLGRQATTDELNPIMACISTGKLTLQALESNSTALCGGSVKGLEALPDFNHKRTKVNTLFRIYLGRLPNASEASRVTSYMSALGSPTYSLAGLPTVANRIKSDYSLGATFTAYHKNLMEDFFSLYYRGRVLSATQQTQLNTTVSNLAKGLVILSQVSDVVRSSSTYQNSEKNSAGLSIAEEAEQFNSLFRTLTNTLPSIEEERAYANILALGKTDTILEPLEWVALNLKSQSAYQSVGGCVVTAPAPQIFIQAKTASASWAKYNPESCICGVGLAAWPANGSCAAVTAPASCPAGQRKIRAYLPRAVDATSLVSATVFGVRTASSFNGVNESASTLNQLSFSYVPFTTGALSLTEITISATVNGPGGSAVKQQKLSTALAKKPAVVISQTNAHHGFGPRLDNSGYPLTNLNITNAIPTVAIVHSAGNKLFLPQELASLGAKQLVMVYAVYNKCNYVPGIAGGGMRGNGSTICSPLIWKDPFSTPAINSIGVEPPAYDPGSEFRMTLDGTNYLLRTANSAAGQGKWATDPWVQSFTTNWSPLVIDFKNQGIQTTDINEGVSFDLVGDGRKDGFSWIKNTNDAAFVVLDRNGNGQIDDIHELFGDNTKGPDGQKSANGFESLKKYDLNNDGLMDSKDAVFGKLQVWFDRNHNGISEASELSLLQEEGVLSLNLDYLATHETSDRFGNETKQKSVAVMADGSFRTVFDLYFVGANVKGQSNLSLAAK